MHVFFVIYYVSSVSIAVKTISHGTMLLLPALCSINSHLSNFVYAIVRKWTPILTLTLHFRESDSISFEITSRISSRDKLPLLSVSAILKVDQPHLLFHAVGSNESPDHRRAERVWSRFTFGGTGAFASFFLAFDFCFSREIFCCYNFSTSIFVLLSSASAFCWIFKCLEPRSQLNESFLSLICLASKFIYPIV